MSDEKKRFIFKVSLSDKKCQDISLWPEIQEERVFFLQ